VSAFIAEPRKIIHEEVTRILKFFKNFLEISLKRPDKDAGNAKYQRIDLASCKCFGMD